MKTFVKKTEKIFAIKRVLESYPAAFEGRTVALEAKDSFLAQATELSQKLNLYLRPGRAGYVDRIANRQQFNELLYKMANIARLLAVSLNDNAMQVILADYGLRFEGMAVSRVLAAASYINEVFVAHEELLPQLGVDPEDRASFDSQLAALVAASNSAVMAADARRVLYQEIVQLIKACNSLLRDQLDRFIRYNTGNYPSLTESYLRIRMARRKRRITEPEAASDISGQVLDSLTNEPIPGATITLVEHAYAEQTDDNGHFELDELEAGSFTLSCHAEGYLVPTPARIELGLSDSVIYNFSLQRAEGTVAA
jgi:hypothetical protein